MSDLQIGRLIDSFRQRDAIHVAVAPVVAAERLHPGERIGFVGASTELVEAVPRAIGIVDPFLGKPVEKQERFWMFLFPNTITSLRHDWTHPAYRERELGSRDKAESEEWLREFAAKVDMTLDELLYAARDWLKSNNYHCFHGFDTPDICYEQKRTLWEHFERFTGETVPEDEKDSSFFTCNC